MRPDQERIAEWLTERAPQLADVYVGAIRLLADPTFSGREKFICHAARDIGNRTPDIFIGEVKRVEMTNDLIDLTELWDASGLNRTELVASSAAAEGDGGVTSGPTKIIIPYQVFTKVQKIVALQRQVTQNRSRATKMVEAVAPENVGRQETLYPLVKQWMDVAGWFVHYAHAGLITSTLDENELQNNFRAFEAYLDALIGEFFGPMDTLDDILEDTNS
ncbi:MAG TPA: hypothetical protein VFK06_00260 [Candidatus Angelobacter sp.]|nr:hypothetical protein [Candidatus Angelobacter sp.]